MIWKLLLSFIGGPAISGLVDAYKAKLAATNTTDQHAIELAKADLLGQIEARKVAASLAGSKIAALIQGAFTVPILIYMFQVIVYDKIYMHGTTATDPITGQVAEWSNTIIEFYFGGQIITGVTRIVAHRFGR